MIPNFFPLSIAGQIVVIIISIGTIIHSEIVVNIFSVLLKYTNIVKRIK